MLIREDMQALNSAMNEYGLTTYYSHQPYQPNFAAAKWHTIPEEWEDCSEYIEHFIRTQDTWGGVQ